MVEVRFVIGFFTCHTRIRDASLFRGMMGIGQAILILIPIFLLVGTAFAQAPEANISNGKVKAKIYLPDTENGYYRATRFDWSGLVADLQYDRHSYYGQWFDNYDPKKNDAVMGPVEEFGPLGYEEAKIGDSFLKIGVGALKKPKQPEYTPFVTYEIMDHGIWKTKVEADKIEFTHSCRGEVYSYEYKKTLILPSGEAKMVLQHSLKNTGKKPIDTQVYDHNFLIIDGQHVGPDYRIKFPFDLEGTGKGLGEFVTLEGKTIQFIKNLEAGDQVHLPDIRGFGKEPTDYEIVVENSKTGAGAKITSDRPLVKLAFWSPMTTVCPEPYIRVKAAPGETFTWSIVYNFYSF